MPMWNGLLPREDLTADLIGRFFKKTALNPAVTLPLILLARFTRRGSDLSILHPLAFSRLNTLFYIGVVRWLSSMLSYRALNNWTEDKYDWKKEIVVVTGGSGGIGGQIVLKLAEIGVTVVVLDIIPLSYEKPPTVHYFKCDISTSSTVAAVAASVRATVGTPTVLINNAGVARGKTILESTETEVRFVFDVNTLAHWVLAREFVPAMVAADHGMVVTVCSLSAYLTVPQMADYAASKAAVLSFHEGLAAELLTRCAAPRVRTVLVSPGLVRTPLFTGYANDSTFLVPTLAAETVADAIVAKVLSGTSGQVLVPGFIATLMALRIMPFWLQVRMRTRGQKIMTEWKGRQVVDPEELYKEKAALRAKEKEEEKAAGIVS